MGGIAGDVISVGSGGLLDGDELLGGLTGSNAAGAAKNAAQAQLQANRENIGFQKDIYNALAGNNSWAQGIGNQALGQLGAMYGLTPGQDPAAAYRFDDKGKLISTPGTYTGGFGTGDAGGGAPNYANFFMSPDYNFALQQGQLGLDRTAASGGSLFSGGRMKEAAQFNQGLASQQFNNYTNRLASLAGVGQTATQSTNNALSGAGNTIGNALTGMGDARASGYIGAANAKQAGYNNLFNLAGGLGSAAIFACDRRLKTNIEQIGEYKGHKWYRFQYVWGDEGQGPMADEVMQTRPDAVLEGPNGILFVNVGAL
jgi:hypothetical protein